MISFVFNSHWNHTQSAVTKKSRKSCYHKKKQSEEADGRDERNEKRDQKRTIRDKEDGEFTFDDEFSKV